MADSRFDYKDSQLDFWADRIATKFPKLTNEKLTEIICLGVEGKWRDKYNNHINLSTIISWIEATKTEAKEVADKERIQKEKDIRNLQFEADEMNMTLQELLQIKANQL